MKLCEFMITFSFSTVSEKHFIFQKLLKVMKYLEKLKRLENKLVFKKIIIKHCNEIRKIMK